MPTSFVFHWRSTMTSLNVVRKVSFLGETVRSDIRSCSSSLHATTIRFSEIASTLIVLDDELGKSTDPNRTTIIEIDVFNLQMVHIRLNRWWQRKCLFSEIKVQLDFLFSLFNETVRKIHQMWHRLDENSERVCNSKKYSLNYVSGWTILSTSIFFFNSIFCHLSDSMLIAILLTLIHLRSNLHFHRLLIPFEVSFSTIMFVLFAIEFIVVFSIGPEHTCQKKFRWSVNIRAERSWWRTHYWAD